MATPKAKAATESTQDTPTTDVAKVRAIDEIVPEVMGGTSSFNEDDLRALTSFDEAVRLATQEHGPIATVSDVLGDGFALLNNKAILTGVPCLFMEWAFRDGDFGRPFVSVRVVARNADGGMSRYIVNDGSTGIAEQLAAYTKKTGKLGGLFAAHGLRKSDYDIETDEGPKAATTYYIDTAV
jgi:hypothetical protein